VIAGIDIILVEDDYKEVPIRDVRPGDVAIYYSTRQLPGSIPGDIEHSGLVIERTPLGGIRILSKWGFGDEWVHFVSDCPYDSTGVRYYRINDS
jgi:hypothetical protein